MSRAFDRFLAELHADGPAKMDGFDLENLRGLGGAERQQAVALLQEAVSTGDSTAVPALVVIDPTAALSFLRAQLAASTHELVRVRIVSTLLEAGRDPEAEQALPELLQSRHAVVRQGAIMATRHLWSNEARLDLLSRILRTEPDQLNRLSAASELMNALGRTPGDLRAPEFKLALAELRSADPARRERVLADLGLGG